MKKAVSAGGVIIQNGKILFTKLTHVGKITFPKGHIEKGETPKMAALREVTEETGFIDIKIVKKLGIVTKPSIERDGTRITKDIHLYLMEITGNTRRENQEEETEWLTIDDALPLMVPQEVVFLKKNKNKLSFHVKIPH